MFNPMDHAKPSPSLYYTWQDFVSTLKNFSVTQNYKYYSVSVNSPRLSTAFIVTTSDISDILHTTSESDQKLVHVPTLNLLHG